MTMTVSNSPRQNPTTQSLLDAGYEKVHTESNWYDGPRSGTADIRRVPHFFVTDITADAPRDQFLVWPAVPDVFELEKRSYAIFVAWWQLFEKGEADVNTHPFYSKPGSDYDLLARKLLTHRDPPADAKPMTADWRRFDGQGHGPEGPNYMMKWADA